MPNQTANHASLDAHMGLFQMFVIHCDCCGENRWERVLATPVEDEIETQNLRPSYTEEAWNDGWRLENGGPICPSCQEMFKWKRHAAEQRV